MLPWQPLRIEVVVGYTINLLSEVIFMVTLNNVCQPEPTTDTEDKGSHVTITIMWSTFPQKHYPRTPLTYFQKA